LVAWSYPLTKLVNITAVVITALIIGPFSLNIPAAILPILFYFYWDLGNNSYFIFTGNKQVFNDNTNSSTILFIS